MIFNVDRFNKKLAQVGFLNCFLIFFIYHMGIYNGLWSNFVPNFFGLSVLIVFLIYMITIKYTISKICEINYMILFFLLFFLLNIFIVTIINFNNYAFYQSLEYFLMIITFITMGFYLKDFPSVGKRKYFILMGVALLFVLNASIFLGKYSLIQDDGVEASGYQSLARSFLTFFVLIFCMYYKSNQRYIVLILLYIGLFFIGARSEFLAFVLISWVFLVLEFLFFKRGASGIIILLAILFYLMTQLNISDIDSRQLQIFDLENSTSWIAREELNQNAIQTIKNNIILGDFGSHVIGDNVGRYAHNYLSGYVNYGIAFIVMFFVIYLYLIIKVLIVSLRADNYLVKYALIMNLVCFLLVIFSKPVFWPVTYLGWGIALGVIYNDRIIKKNNQD